MKLVSLDGTDKGIERSLLPSNVECIFLNAKCLEDIKDEDIADADFIAVWQTIWIDEAFVKRIPKCKCITRIGVGYDNINLKATGDAGIAVCNVPNYGTEEVADSAMCHILNLYRKVAPLIIEIENGKSYHGPGAIAEACGTSSRRIRGQVLGLIGLGRIGTATAVRAKAFGFEIIFYDPYVRDGTDKAIGIERCEVLSDLLARSDCVSLHPNTTVENTKIINKETIAQMKKGAFLVNTARGELVDEEPLAEALKSGYLAGASLDVTWNEPFVKGSDRALGNVPNLMVTPHNAFYSVESYREIVVLGANPVLRTIQGLPVRNCVNKK